MIIVLFCLVCTTAMITLITSGTFLAAYEVLRKFLRAICLWHYLHDCCSFIVPFDYTCVTTLKQVFVNCYVLSYCLAFDGRMMLLIAKKFAWNRTSAEKKWIIILSVEPRAVLCGSLLHEEFAKRTGTYLVVLGITWCELNWGCGVLEQIYPGYLGSGRDVGIVGGQVMS
jgi:hypothetical protein